MKRSSQLVLLFGLCLVSWSLGSTAATAQLPDDGRRLLAYYVGEWEYEWEVDDKTFNGTWSVKWAPDESSTLSHWTSTGPDGPAKGTKITGWDTSKKQMVDLDFSDNGEHVLSRYTSKSDELEVGDGTGSTPDGKVTRVKYTTKKKPNEFTWILTDRVEGDKRLPDLEFVFRRVKSKQ